MTPIQFPEQNMILTPAPGTEENVMPLPCLNDGEQTVSCWLLSPDELAEVNRTGVVWLMVMAGRASPPVCAEAFAPFVPNPLFEN